MEYQSLLQLTLELEGLLTLRIHRSGDAEGANLTELDDMISARIRALAASQHSAELSAEPSISDNSDNSDNSDRSDRSEKSDQSEKSDIPDTSVKSDQSVPSEDDAEIAADALDEETLLADGTPAVTEAIGDRQPAESLYDRLARERAANLSKAFSLNDKFRFRRELFHNSQAEMDEAIEALSQMTTADEAFEYIYDDLCLSPDSPDVKDFMDIITKHF